jgi:hypothetical protein
MVRSCIVVVESGMKGRYKHIQHLQLGHRDTRKVIWRHVREKAAQTVQDREGKVLVKQDAASFMAKGYSIFTG